MADLSLKVDGNPTPVLSLDRQTELPLDLAILIDTSLSQEKAIGMTKPFAKALLQEVLRSSKNRVALVSFANTIEVAKDLTSDVTSLVAALETVQINFPPGYIGGGMVIVGPGPPPRSKNQPGATSLWDTSTAAVEMIFGTAPDQPRTRAMLLLTDGADTASQAKRNSAIKSALDHDVVVYAIGVVAGDVFDVNRDSLKKITQETGGTAAFPKNREDLTGALIEIHKRLGSQYVVSFCRDAGKSGTSKVQIEISNSKVWVSRIAYSKLVK
jgi:VWFA-related protein